MRQVGGWQLRAMLIGAVLGALTGAGAGFLMSRRWAESDEPPRLSSGEGLRLGLLVLGLLREVTQLGDGDR